jgi:hypothetical protein
MKRLAGKIALVATAAAIAAGLVVDLAWAAVKRLA